MNEKRELMTKRLWVSGNDVDSDDPMSEWCLWDDTNAVQAFDEQCWAGQLSDPRRFVLLGCDGEGTETRAGPLDWEMVSAIDGAAFVLREQIAAGKIMLNDKGILDRAALAIASILKEAECPTPS